jgi:hypothetical protein
MDCVAALSFCHLKGVGTDVNFAKAQELCSQCIATLSPMACLVQSLFHLESEAPLTLKKRSALPFLQIAVAADFSSTAAFNLALLFSDTADEFSDIPQATLLLKTAAALGLLSAKEFLAKLEPKNQSDELSLSSSLHGQVLALDKADFRICPQVQPDASNAASPSKAGFAPEICDGFVAQKYNKIYVHSGDAARPKEGQNEDAAGECFAVSSGAQACLAPNMLMLSEDGTFAHQLNLKFSGSDINFEFSTNKFSSSCKGLISVRDSFFPAEKEHII